MKHLILVIKKSILALCMLVFALVGGCGSLAPIVATDYAVASGEVKSAISTVSLSYSERAIIDHAINRYLQFTERWQKADINADKDQFLGEYRELKLQYIEVDKIVRNRWGEYTPELQAELLKHQETAQTLDGAVNKLIRIKMWVYVMRSAAEFGAVSLGLARAAL